MEDNGFLKKAACELSLKSWVREPKKGSWKAAASMKAHWQATTPWTGKLCSECKAQGELSKAWRGGHRPAGALGWASMEEKQLGCANSYLANAPPLWVPQESTLTAKRQNSLSSPTFWASSSTLPSALPSWLSTQATTYCFQCGDCICWQHWSLLAVHPFICCLFKLSPSEFILLFPRSHVTDTPTRITLLPTGHHFQKFTPEGANLRGMYAVKGKTVKIKEKTQI